MRTNISGVNQFLGQPRNVPDFNLPQNVGVTQLIGQPRNVADVNLPQNVGVTQLIGQPRNVADFNLPQNVGVTQLIGQPRNVADVNLSHNIGLDLRRSQSPLQQTIPFVATNLSNSGVNKSTLAQTIPLRQSYNGQPYAYGQGQSYANGQGQSYANGQAYAQTFHHHHGIQHSQFVEGTPTTVVQTQRIIHHTFVPVEVESSKNNLASDLNYIDKLAQENSRLNQLLGEKDQEILDLKARLGQPNMPPQNDQSDRLTLKLQQAQGQLKNLEFTHDVESSKLQFKIQTLEHDLKEQGHLENRISSLEAEVGERKKKFDQLNRQYHHVQEKLSNAFHEIDVMKSKFTGLQIHEDPYDQDPNPNPYHYSSGQKQTTFEYQHENVSHHITGNQPFNASKQHYTEASFKNENRAQSSSTPYMLAAARFPNMQTKSSIPNMQTPEDQFDHNQNSSNKFDNQRVQTPNNQFDTINEFLGNQSRH